MIFETHTKKIMPVHRAQIIRKSNNRQYNATTFSVMAHYSSNSLPIPAAACLLGLGVHITSGARLSPLHLK